MATTTAQILPAAWTNKPLIHGFLTTNTAAVPERDDRQMSRSWRQDAFVPRRPPDNVERERDELDRLAAEGRAPLTGISGFVRPTLLAEQAVHILREGKPPTARAYNAASSSTYGSLTPLNSPKLEADFAFASYVYSRSTAVDVEPEVRHINKARHRPYSLMGSYHNESTSVRYDVQPPPSDGYVRYYGHPEEINTVYMREAAGGGEDDAGQQGEQF